MSKKHRGRIQAQGGGTEKSVSWAQDEPLTKADGLQLLSDLKEQLTEKELKLREKQLKDAERYINNANGIDAVKSKTFLNMKEKDIRIDIEINGGTAFVCIVIFILLLFLILN
ncbi:MAG: hypothetical protein ACK4TA_20940 [Saprospiraceae bacterium]